MKYLKRYKIFEMEDVINLVDANDDFNRKLIPDINDICLDIEDEGFTVWHNLNLDGSGDGFKRHWWVEINKEGTGPKTPFYIDEVLDVIKRLNDFLSQNEYNIDYIVVYKLEYPNNIPSSVVKLDFDEFLSYKDSVRRINIWITSKS